MSPTGDAGGNCAEISDIEIKLANDADSSATAISGQRPNSGNSPLLMRESHTRYLECDVPERLPERFAIAGQIVMQ